MRARSLSFSLSVQKVHTTLYSLLTSATKTLLQSTVSASYSSLSVYVWYKVHYLRGRGVLSWGWIRCLLCRCWWVVTIVGVLGLYLFQYFSGLLICWLWMEWGKLLSAVLFWCLCSLSSADARPVHFRQYLLLTKPYSNKINVSWGPISYIVGHCRGLWHYIHPIMYAVRIWQEMTLLLASVDGSLPTAELEERWQRNW